MGTRMWPPFFGQIARSIGGLLERPSAHTFGASMSRRPRQDRSRAFQAKVALAALKNDVTLVSCGRQRSDCEDPAREDHRSRTA